MRGWIETSNDTAVYLQPSYAINRGVTSLAKFRIAHEFTDTTTASKWGELSLPEVTVNDWT